MGVKKKLNFWLRGVYLTHEIFPKHKAKHSNLNVFYLPHQRISSSIPFCIVSNREYLDGGYEEQLIRCTIVPVTTVFGEKGVRMYLHFTGIKPKKHIKTKAVISWVYEKAMTNTFRREGSLFIPEKDDLVVFTGTNGGRFAYSYSIFITRKDINFNEPDLGDTFVHHRGIGACAVARSAGVAISNETASVFPLPAKKEVRGDE